MGSLSLSPIYGQSRDPGPEVRGPDKKAREIRPHRNSPQDPYAEPPPEGLAVLEDCDAPAEDAPDQENVPVAVAVAPIAPLPLPPVEPLVRLEPEFEFGPPAERSTKRRRLSGANTI